MTPALNIGLPCKQNQVCSLMMMAMQRTPRGSATRLCHRDGDKASRVAQSSAPRGPHIRAHAGLLTPEALAAAQRVLLQRRRAFIWLQHFQ